MDVVMKLYAEPHRKEKYLFARNNLTFLSTNKCHVPVLYFPVSTPKNATVLVYSHGSGSSLNNVYEFARFMYIRYNIAVVAYDYTGEGESQLEFSSYEEDLKLVLAYVLMLGYDLGRTILCGFSLGSYSALSLNAQMPRILISPVCGILSFFDGEGKGRRFSE
jgi:pimeloyl-ACP methyl ester carboxylesterase